MEEVAQPTSTSSKAAQPAIVQSFTIEKLYGYRTISLSSEYAATVLIAKNGTGKTTLLGALDALLKMQLYRLRDLPFEIIRLQLRDIPKEIIITHDDVIDYLRIPDEGELARLAVRVGSEASVLFQHFSNLAFSSYREDRFSHTAYDDRFGANLRRAYNYNNSEIENIYDRVKTEIFTRQPNVAHAWYSIREAMDGMEIVYLPTYRRIELSLSDDTPSDPYARSKPPRFAVASGSLYPGDIQFGLADIQDRLKSLNNSIIGNSNNGYRRISANIINDLIDGSFAEQTYLPEDLPSKDELSLFFDRIKDGRNRPPYDAVVAPNLERLASTNDMPDASKQFLSYFLGQLGQVIDTTRDAEVPVNTFVNMCNKYLSSEEPSTELGDGGSTYNEDTKALRLNRKNLSVHVENLSTGRRILLNALSSGEKQMISLFAKLFLYPKRKIVLIDEPELSLSIDWQAQILVDVINAPLCEQVVAITHSPFVFENELDPFARPLKITIDKADEPQTSHIDENSIGFEDDGE